MSELLETPLTVLHIIVCVFLVLIVLLQPGKSGGLGAALGGAGAQQVFGGRGAGNFLSKLTWASASLFFATSMVLAYLSSSVDDSLQERAAAIQVPLGEAGSSEPKGDTPAPVLPAGEPVTPAPASEEPAEEQPAEEQPAEEQPAEEQPAEEQPAEERANPKPTPAPAKPAAPSPPTAPAKPAAPAAPSPAPATPNPQGAVRPSAPQQPAAPATPNPQGAVRPSAPQPPAAPEKPSAPQQPPAAPAPPSQPTAPQPAQP